MKKLESSTSTAASAHDLTIAALEALLIRHNGRIGPATLLNEARDPHSPFHDYFDWDDERAGERYRLAQASALLRRWKGVIVRMETEAKHLSIQVTRRVQSPADQRGKGRDSYEDVEQIMADPDKRDNLLQTVLRELLAYRKRYAELSALADVWRALDEVVELHAEGRTTGPEAAEIRSGV